MFSLIQLPNLRWIPKALWVSPSPQKPSPTQFAKDTIQENVRYFILIRYTVLLINSNRKRFNCRPLPMRIFEMLSQNCYLSVTYPTIEHHTIAIFMIFAFRSASSKGILSTKSTERLRSQNTFLVVLLSPLQVTHILKIDRLKCTSPFTLHFSHGLTIHILGML